MKTKYKIGSTVKVVECMLGNEAHIGLVGKVVYIEKDEHMNIVGNNFLCTASKVQLEPKKEKECKCHCHINTGVWGLKKAICCSPTKAIKPIETFKSWHLDIKGERHYTAERETTLEMVGKINELVRAVTNLKK